MSAIKRDRHVKDGSPTADRDGENGELSSLDAVDDPVSLTDGVDTAEARELSDERFALLLGNLAS